MNYIAVLSDNYIAHRRHSSKGWTKKGHKYIERYWKNGRWIYIYRAPNKSNPIELSNNKSVAKAQIKSATEDAYDRYRQSSRQYIRMEHENASKSAKKQELNRNHKLYSDYEKTEAAEKEALNELLKYKTKEEKKENFKYYTDKGLDFVGDVLWKIKNLSIKNIAESADRTFSNIVDNTDRFIRALSDYYKDLKG